MLVEAAHRTEVRRCVRADDCVGLGVEQCQRVGGTDGYGGDDASRPEASYHGDGCSGCCSGGEPVVHDDRDPAGQPQRLPTGPVEQLASGQLALLMRGHVGHIVGGDARLDRGVVHQHATRAERGEGDFGRPRHAELADHQHIHGNAQPPGHLDRNRYAAAHEPEYGHVGAVGECQQLPRKYFTRVPPVAVYHSLSLRSCGVERRDASIWAGASRGHHHPPGQRKFRRELSGAADTVVDVRQDLRILSDRRFVRLLGARTCSVLGSAFGPVALAFGVLGLPGATPTTLSLVVFAESLSMVVFMLLGGVIADRLPRFRVMVAADAGAALAWGALAAMLITGWAPLGVLIALAALAGLATAMFFPAFTGVVPEVVPAANLQSANGILRLGMNVARIGGFAVAGGAVALLGAGWAMALNSGLLVASALLLAGLRLPTGSKGEPGHMLRDLREGWREFRSRQWLWVVVAQYTFVVMAVQAIWGVFGPVIAKQSYGGAKGWALVLAAESIGMLVGVFVAMRARPRRPIRLVVLMSFPLVSLPVALALGAPLAVAVVASLLGGVALDILSVVWETTMQREIPAAALSRVSSYDALGSLMFGPLGLMLAGPAVSLLGIHTALLVSASIMTVASLAALCSPGVRNLQWTDRTAEPVEADLAAEAAAEPVGTIERPVPTPVQLGVPVAVVGAPLASGVRDAVQLELLEVGGRQAAQTSNAIG